MSYDFTQPRTVRVETANFVEAERAKRDQAAA
jgi:hypothetical protein